jgi:hypothetical protein
MAHCFTFTPEIVRSLQRIEQGWLVVSQPSRKLRRSRLAEKITAE